MRMPGPEEGCVDREGFAAGSKPRASCVHRPDRRTPHGLADWSVAADDSEFPDGRDDLRFDSFLPRQWPFDLPSLFPSPLDSRPLGRDVAIAPPHHSPPLRC